MTVTGEPSRPATVSYPAPAGSTTSHGSPSAVSWVRMFRTVREGPAPALPVTRTP